MINVLLLSQHFAPENTIAAIRFTKVIKYLVRMEEYHFWVICRRTETDIKDGILQRDIEEVAGNVTILPVVMKKPLTRIRKLIEGSKQNDIASQEQKGTRRKTDVIYRIQNDFVSNDKNSIVGRLKRLSGKVLLTVNDFYNCIFEDVLFSKRGLKLSKQLPLNEIDVMISTYGGIGDLLLALKLKKARSSLKWIVDYRDIINAQSMLYLRYLKKVASRADKKSDYITGATKSCVGSGKYLEKFEVITNGFDREDIKGFGLPRRNEKLQIAYTGTVYYKKSDMTLLFQIISELSEKELVDKDRIEVVYAGKQFSLLEQQADQFGLKDILSYKGVVARKEALQIQYNANILCSLSVNRKGYNEILTGKFIEYFMMQKPIFSIIIGNEPGSIIKKITERARLGYCLEEAGGTEDYKDAKQWFLEKYLEFVQNGCIAGHSDKSVLEEYNSNKVAEKFKGIIEVCVER